MEGAYPQKRRVPVVAGEAGHSWALNLGRCGSCGKEHPLMSWGDPWIHPRDDLKLDREKRAEEGNTDEIMAATSLVELNGGR